jgi:hypothetical protein
MLASNVEVEVSRVVSVEVAGLVEELEAVEAVRDSGVVVVEVVNGKKLELEAVAVEECVMMVLLLSLAAAMVVVVVWRPVDHRNNTQFNSH